MKRRSVLRGLGLLVVVCGVFANGNACCAASEIADEPNTDKPLLALDTGGHTNAVYKVIVSPYKDQLISLGLDKTIRLWDLSTGEPLRVLRPPVGPGAHGYLFSAALSPDDNLLAVGTYRALTPLYDHRIHLIDLNAGEIVRSLKGHSYTIYDLAFSPDGERLASASHDGTVRIWEVKTGRSLLTLKGHSAPVHGVAWSPDGKRVVSGSIDKTARIWSAETGVAIAVMREHQEEISTVGWSPDGLTIATGGYDKAIRLYEPSGKYRYAWQNLPNMVMSLKFSPDSKRLIYTYGSNTVPPIGATILDMVKGPKLAQYNGHENSPICCVFTPDGKQVITGDVISRIRVWNSTTGATQLKLDGRGQTMFAAGWSRDGQAIAWGTRTGNDTNDIGNPLERTFCLRNLDFGPPPDKTFVRAKAALGSLRMGYNVSETPINMRKVVFLRNETRFNTFTLPQPYDQIRCYGLLPDNRAVIGGESGAYLIDVQSGLILHEMSDRGEELWGLAPSPSNRYVLTAGNDQVMRVWELDSGELLVAFFVAGDEWIAWTPQGYYAASLAGESLMGWHLNRGPEKLADFYPASQFHKSLYRPDVIRRLLETGELSKAIELADHDRTEKSRVIRVADVLPAEVKILQPTATRVEQTESTFTIRAAAEPTNNQPVTSMQLVIDGRAYGPARPVAAPPDGTAAKVENEWKVELPPGTYNVAVKAEAAHSYALSDPVEVTRPASEGEALPKLYVLSVGTATEGNSAAAVSKAMSAAGKGVFGEVVTHVLDGEQATPAAVSAELEKIRSQATLADTTLIYYAGQEILDTAGHYRLSAARGGSQDPAGVWFSDKELKRQLAAIPGHTMLALDTMRAQQHQERESTSGFCGSSTSENGTDRLDTAASDFLRELLTEDYGIVVLRASRRSSAARTQAGISPFAQAFSEAVGGRANFDQDGAIHLQELSRYMSQRVRELTGGKQAPVIERPRGMRSFPLAKPQTTAPAARGTAP